MQKEVEHAGLNLSQEKVNTYEDQSLLKNLVVVQQNKHRPRY